MIINEKTISAIDTLQNGDLLVKLLKKYGKRNK